MKNKESSQRRTMRKIKLDLSTFATIVMVFLLLCQQQCWAFIQPPSNMLRFQRTFVITPIIAPRKDCTKCIESNPLIFMEATSTRKCPRRILRNYAVALTTAEEGDDSNKVGQKDPSVVYKLITLYAPLWTILAAIIGITQSSRIAPTLGNLTVTQISLAGLMLSMGLTITPEEVAAAFQKPIVLISNILLCFGMMPLLALAIASFFQFNPSQTAGIVLLGSVSGGQASNLFTLLAGGDVALSVVCTLTTTLIGVLATPILIKRLLNCIVVVNGYSVLKSVASLVLIPLLIGLSLGRIAPLTMQRNSSVFPLFGIVSTLVLVAGGAANSASGLLTMNMKTIGASCVLAILGGGMTLLLSSLISPNKLSKESRRMLVVETLSKSPTLAYVLAQKHFGSSAGAIPAAGMVTLAVIGATVAALWNTISPLNKSHQA